MSSALSLVIVNDFGYVEGGASKVALSSAVGLAMRGHSVTLLYGVGPPMPSVLEAPVNVVSTGDQDISRVGNPFRAGVQGIWNSKAYEAMDKILSRLDPARTIVHVHSWTKALSSSVIRAATRKGCHVICTIHDYFSVCPNGGFFNYPKSEVCRLEPMSVSCALSRCDKRSYAHKLWRLVRQLIQNRVGGMPRDIKHYIAVSDFSKNIIKSSLPKNIKIFDLANPIDVLKSEPVKVRENRSFVMVGRLSQEKGPHLFARAASDLDLPVMFIGNGECLSDVEKICGSAKILGWRTQGEVLSQLREARVLVFPSLWYETQGLSLLEAAALGVPSIVSDCCAARDSVVDTVTGLWFKGGDKDDLCRKIRILQDDETVETMGQSAYDRYWSHPSTLQAYLAKLEGIYQEVQSTAF